MASRYFAHVVTSAGSTWDRCGGREVAVDTASSSWQREAEEAAKAALAGLTPEQQEAMRALLSAGGVK